MTDRLLVLVRHGESEWNLKEPLHRLEDPDLTEKGIQEAQATGKELEARG